MGIVNAGMLAVYDEIDPELRKRVEDVVLAKDADAGERLLEYAEEIKDQNTKKKIRWSDLSWRKNR